MKRVSVTLAMLIVFVAAAGALGLPGGGGKVDTTKIDNCITAINDVSSKFETTKVKIDTCQKNLADIATAHGIAGVLTDLSKAVALKDALTDEEKTSLKNDVTALATVATDIQGLTTGIPDILTNQLPAALADVVAQIQANPLKAGDLKNKQEQLNAGKDALMKITTDAPATVESANALVGTINGII